MLQRSVAFMKKISILLEFVSAVVGIHTTLSDTKKGIQNRESRKSISKIHKVMKCKKIISLTINCLVLWDIR